MAEDAARKEIPLYGDKGARFRERIYGDPV